MRYFWRWCASHISRAGVEQNLMSVAGSPKGGVVVAAAATGTRRREPRASTGTRRREPRASIGEEPSHEPSADGFSSARSRSGRSSSARSRSGSAEEPCGAHRI